jgi:hypothetical protein
MGIYCNTLILLMDRDNQIITNSEFGIKRLQQPGLFHSRHKPPGTEVPGS